MYRWVLYIAVPIVIILPFIVIKRKNNFKNSIKAANVSLVNEDLRFKKKLIIYKILSVIALMSLWVAIAVSFVMISRPVEVKTISKTLRNRDIFLCLDISDSMDELNQYICDDLKDLVNGLDGERFGITIFCGKTVVLVPLTTDYDYVLAEIDKLQKSFEQSTSYWDWYSDFDYEAYEYKYAGTLSDYGSSLIGDGIAGCLFAFPDLRDNPDRARIMILSTDNEVFGDQIVTVTEATDLCAKYGVKIFALGPDYVVDEEQYKKDIEKTGGEYYRIKSKSAVQDVIDAISVTDATDTQEFQTLITDKPIILFYILIVCVGIYFITGRKVRL
ncbi:MAG: VWA domain-containing protein [Lachnospiraceae bacterium]|nr:VWA domain-containing protein [Lachnospiraceae bacterium]